MMKNTLFVLLDGMEDDPNPALGGKKPYETARMPFLHKKMPFRLTTEGRGYTQVFLSEFFTGHPTDAARAALEAQGLGLDMGEGRTAFRLSPARIKDGMVRWSYEGEKYEKELIESVSSHMNLLDKHRPEIKFFNNGRAVITMEYDYPLPPLGSPPVDAPYRKIPGPLGELILKVQEDIGITDYPWGCGKKGSKFEPYVKQMRAVSSSPTALGVAASLGYDIELFRNIGPRMEAAVKALEKGNVFLHFDEVDEYSHEKDHMKKINILEKIDSLMETHFSDAERIICFVDHGTSCVTGEHILMNVPLWTNIEPGMSGKDVIPLKDVVPLLMKP